ncbi:uncharacterized protein LOC128869271 [Anastrepha ludens]|uniref:uncharacterized protein LOC128869271 n=1 Tax=Anastrepha ludens TaxID=28586 RepID=UPI0023B0B64A|nr:uncharacterized protein LOC128869271 [Anastrepha ludens]
MGKHKNSKQELILVEFMESHPDLAKNFSKGDRVAVEEKWKELTTLLNAKELPQKDFNGWKKIWSDWKWCIRKKVTHNNLESRATGGGPFNKHVLTSNEECIARTCGIFAAIEGKNHSKSFETEENNSAIESEEERPQTSREAVATPRAAKRPRVSTQDSLQTCIATQSTCMEKISTTLDNICENQHKIAKSQEDEREEIRRLCRAVEKQNELLAEQNRLKTQSIEQKHRHYLKMEQLQHETVKIKIKMLEIETKK